MRTPTKAKAVTPPTNLESFREAIIARHETLSPRLRQIAAYVLEHSNEIGLENQAEIARRCGVHPPTMVRFAKEFGFTGAGQMQRLFRDELINSAPSRSWTERLRQANLQTHDGHVLTPYKLVREFAAANIVALGHLQETISPDALEQAVDMIDRAASVYICGLRRSFSIAVWLAYALRHVDKPVHLLDGLGGMLGEQTELIRKTDLMFAISFRPYAKETADAVTHAKLSGVPVIAISDTELSPVSRHADVSFNVKDAEVRNFRSLTGSMCIVQALVISYAQRIESGRASV
jgi:DNA-binding MurR/RpiR family transcriptional regulator